MYIYINYKTLISYAAVRRPYKPFNQTWSKHILFVPFPGPSHKALFFSLFLLFSHLFPSKTIFSLEGFHNKATDNAGFYF